MVVLVVACFDRVVGSIIHQNEKTHLSIYTFVPRTLPCKRGIMGMCTVTPVHKLDMIVQCSKKDAQERSG